MPLRSVLGHFPPMRFAFAYGSGVFAQRGNVPSMIDLVFAVDAPEEWHAENLKTNSHHYSFMKHLGPGAIAQVQNTAAKLWFNPNVEIDGRVYKYGVLSTTDLLLDLTDWRYMYVSGRMQKPVQVLQADDDIALGDDANRRAALAFALLTLGPYFTEEDLYHEIAKISYGGDVRMLFGEDPQKTRKIVEGSFAQFGPYYSAVLASDPFAAVVRPGAHGELWRQDVGVESTNALLRQLPPSLQARVTPLGAEEAVQTGLQAMRAARVRPMHAHVQGVVWRVSIAQTCKGLLTAGVSKAWTYAMRKLKIGAASAG